jgi:hypothetical protein
MIPAAIAPIVRAAPDVLRALGAAIDAGERDPEVARDAIARRRQRDALRAARQTEGQRQRAEARRQRAIREASAALSRAIRRDPASAGPLVAPLLALLDDDDVAALRPYLPPPESP